MSALRTRKPTGDVAYPFLMVEGGEKDGKSHLALSLSASEKVGRTFVFELGERTADEYAPLGNYEIVDHNGTYADLLAQAHAVVVEPRVHPDKPNVVIVDSDSMFWALHKDTASAAARRSQRAVKILEKDPDADIDVSSTYWNKAADKWWAFHNLLRAWDGITVLTVRAGLVTKFQNGQPVANQTEWSRDVQKGTPFAMTGIVRVGRRSGQPPKLVEVQSLNVDIPRDGLVLPDGNALEYLIFDLLGAGGGFTQSPVVNPVAGIVAADAKNQLWADACDHLDRDVAKDAAAAAWEAAGLTGRAEITEQEYATARAMLPDSPGSAAPVAQDAPEAPGGTAGPGSPSEATQRLVVEPPERDRLGEIRAEVVGTMTGAQVKDALLAAGMDATGSVKDCRERLIGARAADEGLDLPDADLVCSRCTELAIVVADDGTPYCKQHDPDRPDGGR